MPHAVELGDGDVGLGETAGEVAGVVFDAVAVADGLDHFEVEAGALVDALGFDQAAFLFEVGFPLA